MSLDEIIRAEIQRENGRIPFERFMEMALYQPQYGYYTREGRSPVGKGGDFVTSVSLGPLFGTILAQSIRQFQAALSDPAFCVVEYGAHRGALREQILGELPGLAYVTIDHGDPEPEIFSGCVLANELLDALPVHRVRVTNGQWLECFVEEDPAGGFRESFGPLSSPRIPAALNGLPVALMEGFTTEVNVRALDWIENLSHRLTRGYALIIDYGFERHEYFAPHRVNGTLTSYRDHRRGSNPLIAPGTQDITAHVEFSSFIAKATSCGFTVETFEDQGRFLLKTGEALIRSLVEKEAGQFSSVRGTLNQLTHPSMMGQAFKVLVLKKE